MEEAFKKVIKHVFNNWTGLKLAVDHSMGGPSSKQLAIDCMEEVENYCLHEPNIDVDQIQDFLEDEMDEKFDTVFEDGSTREISTILYRFIELLKAGDLDTCETEYQKLPTANFEWLQEKKIQAQKRTADSSSEEDSENEVHTTRACHLKKQ
ncbi:hypothetical protein JTB14_024603 [Gonioctena quinquepunctata]|nr:hypothetical protein JTB14_024603 [Gonioctena quinquepunctata]